MKYHLFTIIKHSARENDKLTFDIIFCFVCIILVLTIYRLDRQYFKLKKEVFSHSLIRKIGLNLFLWIGAILGTYVTLKKIINY